jgi:hypothetical protein
MVIGIGTCIAESTSREAAESLLQVIVLLRAAAAVMITAHGMVNAAALDAITRNACQGREYATGGTESAVAPTDTVAIRLWDGQR